MKVEEFEPLDGDTLRWKLLDAVSTTNLESIARRLTQHLSHLIREGVIEGEIHLSLAGRKFDMVRRDQLDLARAAIDGSIDMKTAGALLGLTKGRTRQILQLLFPDAKKLGVAASTPWSVPRAAVENLLEVQNGLTSIDS